ncbi:chorismate synthase [Christensenella timonensis]|uniref:chorismate synthase n=1 Tax=Christensenella timonensis TaxID=1816678 RepID=UPI000836F4AD|nr:chorismate synthase [Christensenella timonensis]
MSATFGKILKTTVFGESHSAAIGVVIDGLPAGMEIDEALVREGMRRRAPNKSDASTKRSEPDLYEIVSGFFKGKATGTPLCAIIRNKDTRSQDYEKTAALLRPGHADYTGIVKYNGANDYRGGGHFSGRLTAPLVFAGSIARQFLDQKGIKVGVRIRSIADVADQKEFAPGLFEQVEKKDFPVVDDTAGERMREVIAQTRLEGDSVGGVLECVIGGVPAGLGEPFFDSMESRMAHMMFSIPAIKGIEFGDGFAITVMRGSKANDVPAMEDEKVTFQSNHNGGINGGISNGMPIVFRVAVKPTASIFKPQETLNIKTMKNETLQIHGRHDTCIALRAVEAVKCAAALVAADLFLEAQHD